MGLTAHARQPYTPQHRPAMKRKCPTPPPPTTTQPRSKSSSSPASVSASAGSYFTGATVLLIEDGRESGVSAKRAELFIKKIKEAGTKQSARVLKAAHITGGKRLSAQERDKQLLHVTHVVTGLASLGARGILEGLHVIDPGEEETDPSTPPEFKIVGPDWLTACFQQRRLVATASYELPFDPLPPPPVKEPPQEEEQPPTLPPPKKKKQQQPPPRTRAEIEAVLAHDYPPDMDPETREAFIAWGGPLRVERGRDLPQFACFRPTPRQHANQHLTGVFEEVMAFYGAGAGKEPEKRYKQWGRALAVVRAWPRRIASSTELRGARNVGDSTLNEVDQILARGTTDRLEEFRADPHAVGLRDIHRIYQVGPKTAAKWYAAGYHSVQQIMDELDAAPGGDCTQTLFYQTLKPSHEPWMGVLHFRDYSQPMDRASVGKLAAVVKQAALTALARRGLGPETLLMEIGGSYRRGKEACGDADILVSCARAEGQKGLRTAMKGVLKEEMGYDLIVLKEGAAVQGYSSPSDRIDHEDVEAHDNMLTLIKFKGLYRRLDIISPPPDQWGACVLGWAGTMQMEKELRKYAEEKGWYLTQQAIFDRETGKRLRNPDSPDGVFHREEDIWAFMGLKYMPLRLRWA